MEEWSYLHSAWVCLELSLHKKNLPWFKKIYIDFNAGKNTAVIFFVLFPPHLEELHSNTSKHKLEQCGDDDDVADGPDGHKHALHHMLEYPQKTRVNTRWMHNITFVRHVHVQTFNPLALLMALSGLSTRSTRRIFTTLMALDLKHIWD